MPTISLSIRGLTATLAIVVTLPSESRVTGVFFLTAWPTSTATVRCPGRPSGDCATALSPVNHPRGGNHLASSSVLPSRPEAAAQPAAATTASPNRPLLLVISASCPWHVHRRHGFGGQRSFRRRTLALGLPCCFEPLLIVPPATIFAIS